MIAVLGFKYQNEKPAINIVTIHTPSEICNDFGTVPGDLPNGDHNDRQRSKFSCHHANESAMEVKKTSFITQKT